MPFPDNEILRSLQARVRLHRINQQVTIERFGHIRPTVHIPDYAGYRFVGVRGRLYYSKKWNYFSDFLFEYEDAVVQLVSVFLPETTPAQTC
jgi:hypothetical protein